MQHAIFHSSALALALSAALLLPASAFAQSTSAGSPNGQATSPQATGTSGGQQKTLQEITVIGSRIPRTQVEGDAPVTVVTGAEIKAQGYTTLFEFMNSLPQVAVTDFASRPSTWGSTAVNARTLNLRGLGPDHALLLVDGHRMVD